MPYKPRAAHRTSSRIGSGEVLAVGYAQGRPLVIHSSLAQAGRILPLALVLAQPRLLAGKLVFPRGGVLRVGRRLRPGLTVSRVGAGPHRAGTSAPRLPAGARAARW